MAYANVKCATCGGTLLVELSRWNELAQGTNSVPCLLSPCSGTMHKHGRTVVRRTTINKRRTLAGLEKQQERATRPGRGKRKTPDWVVPFDEDEDEQAPKRRKQDEDDEEFVAFVDFRPSMRYTATDMEAMRDFANMGAPGTPKATGAVPVTNAVSGEREKSTNNCFGGVAAWKFAQKASAPNAGKYDLLGHGHYEWCHLRGVALGGLTLSSNLVAGHYALNTWMMTVESVLTGKSGLTIEVTAYCEKTDIADSVNYKISRSSGGKVLADLWIDGRVTCFSKDDYNNLIDWLAKLGLRKGGG